MKKNKYSGFTLVEMVVVLVIIAILATIGISALTGYIQKANKTKVMANLRQLTLAAETKIAEAYSDGSLDSYEINKIIPSTTTGTLGKELDTLSATSGGVYRVNYAKASGAIKTIVFSSGDYVGIFFGEGCPAMFLNALGKSKNTYEIYTKDEYKKISGVLLFLSPTENCFYFTES